MWSLKKVEDLGWAGADHSLRMLRERGDERNGISDLLRIRPGRYHICGGKTETWKWGILFGETEHRATREGRDYIVSHARLTWSRKSLWRGGRKSRPSLSLSPHILVSSHRPSPRLQTDPWPTKRKHVAPQRLVLISNTTKSWETREGEEAKKRSKSRWELLELQSRSLIFVLSFSCSVPPSFMNVLDCVILYFFPLYFTASDFP